MEVLYPPGMTSIAAGDLPGPICRTAGKVPKLGKLAIQTNCFQPWPLGSARLSPFFFIHTPQFRSRIGWLDSSRFIALRFASCTHLC